MTYRRSIETTACLTILCCSTAVVTAQIDPEHFCLLGDYPFGPASELAVDSERAVAFYQSGQRIVAVDWTDPSDLQFLSSSLAPAGYAQDMFYDETTQRLYLAEGAAGMEIWDVADPVQPALLGSIQLDFFGVNAPIRKVIVVGNLAYVATTYRGVSTINVTDPTNPIAGGGLAPCPTFVPSPCDSSPDGVFFADDGFVYSSGRNTARLGILPNGNLGEAWVVVDGGRDIKVAGNVAFTIKESLGMETGIVASSIPVYTFADTYTPWVNDLALNGNIAYAATSAGYGLRVIDVSNPFNLVDIAAVPNISASNIFLHEQTLLLTTGEGLLTMDIADPMLPVEADRFSLGAFFVGELIVLDDHAYVASGNVGIMDVSDPAAPGPVGSFTTAGFTTAVERSGDVLFVNETAPDASTSAVTSLDISNASSPVFLDSFNAVDQPAALAVKENTVFVAEYPTFPATRGGLRILDATDPAQLGQTGHVLLPTDERGTAIAISETHAYLGVFSTSPQGQNGVRVVDIGNPANPALGMLVANPAGSFAADMTAESDRLYVAYFEDGVAVYDLTNPAVPVEIGRYDPEGQYATNVHVIDGIAYVTGNDAARIVDLTNPAQPVELAVAPTQPGFPGSPGLFVDGDLMYVGEGGAGLKVFGNCSIPSDVNGDGVVDVLDLLAVLAAWGDCTACPEDINADGTVNVLDLLAVLADWGSGS